MKRPFVLLALVACAAAVLYELETSHLQSVFFSRLAQTLTWEVEEGPSTAIAYPRAGPFDLRAGYTDLPRFLAHLESRGFAVARQARFSPELLEAVHLGLAPPYAEKARFGLTLRDREGALLFAARHPLHQWRAYEEIPPLIVDTLLFLENRELLSPQWPRRNPAVEWDRLLRVSGEYLLAALTGREPAAGGSTLATQLEKFRHSPQGVTHSPLEKLRQMASASLRAYREGPDTRARRRELVLDYLNSTPLAARPGHGEVAGLRDGLWAWFAIDPREADRWLAAPDRDPWLAPKAKTYRAVLALLLAQRRPSHYLRAGRAELEALVDRHLRLLAARGVISPELAGAALRERLEFASPPAARLALERPSKAAEGLRAELLELLDVDRLYRLDRLDLTVDTTLDGRLQEEVEQFLEALADPANAASLGLLGERLLRPDRLHDLRLAVVLYEKTPQGFALRVRADNLDQPLDLNENSKLDLGSTAKLRTLISYLEAVETAYHRFRAGALRATPTDPIRDFVRRFLNARPDASLEQVLAAALERRYSASPHEWFFTGGGLHRFRNFDRGDDRRVLTVAEAFERSVNLVFVRLMRDVVRFHVNEIPQVETLVAPGDTPLHRQYLERFAERESRTYLRRFWKRYAGRSQEEMLTLLASRIRPVPWRLAAAYLSVRPAAGQGELARFLAARLGEAAPDATETARLWRQYGADRFTLNDRAYLAGLHPLELWLVGRLVDAPDIGWDRLLEESASARREAYRWLFRSRSPAKRLRRIRTVLEEEAFAAIHRRWQALGYPFRALVPSYATALGASADRPAALAELIGILLNDGVRLPVVTVERLHFAAGTPWETRLVRSAPKPQRVLSPEVARTVRAALQGVVERGTARRLAGVYRDAEGRPLAVGGKTGTGDHRRRSFAAGGRLLAEEVVNRNAIFTFFLGERYFGTILVNVPGEESAAHHFTSAVPVAILAALEPLLGPRVAGAPGTLAGAPAQEMGSGGP
ncbi:MAG: hypothetical protein KatS3mg124_1320 [Porticoccaceae bacterium]|nr:MAG: hypothetical protein KatS3mg124_1320 [Porticoccaceae bacterium]